MENKTYHNGSIDDMDNMDNIMDNINEKESSDKRVDDTNIMKKKKKNTRMMYILLGVLPFIVIIIAVLVVAVVFTPVVEENKKNKALISQLNTTLNQLRTELRTISQSYGNIDKTIEDTVRDLTLLRSSTWNNISNLISKDEDIAQEIAAEKKMRQFAFIGFNYGLNKEGKIEQRCRDGGASNVHNCLAYCFQRSQQESDLDGAVYNRVNNDCCCTYNTDRSQQAVKDNNFLNYRLTREKSI